MLHRPQELRRNFLAWTVRQLHIGMELRGRQLQCNCHSVGNGNGLVVLVLEILRLILIVVVCIVLAAPIELHPVGAVENADARTTSG